MQLLERVKNCNGCGTCVVGCKYACVKMKERTDEEAIEVLKKYPEKNGLEGKKLVPVINEDGCSKCNACILYCPLYMPVDLPEFEEWYEFDEAFANRDMPAIYRAAMREIKSGMHVEFVGTLCEIAGMKALLGDRIPRNLILKPLFCSPEKRDEEPCCRNCQFY